MWPFSRKPDPSSAPEPAPPQVHFDWKGLPPIQRSIADHPLTVPTQSFASDLATHDDPRVVAEPLGHQVSLEAPPGIVLGIARTQTRSEGPDLISRPRTGRRSAVQRILDESAVEDPGGPQVERIEDDEPTAAVTPLRRLAPSSDPAPTLQLTRVSAETEPTPLEPEIPTRVEEQPAAVVQSPEAAEPATTEVPSYPRLTLGQARRLGLGAPIKRVPETATSVQRMSEVATRSSESTARPTSGIQEEKSRTFEPFILDYLVNVKPEVRAPAPISRPQRIPIAVSRSAQPQPSSPWTAPAPEFNQESSLDPTATPPSTPAAVQRDSKPADVDDVPVQLTPMSVAEPPIESSAEPTIEAIAGPPAIVATTDPKRTLLADAPEGEAGEGEGEAMPPLPLALGAKAKERESNVSEIEISSPTTVPHDPAESGAMPNTSSLAPLVSERSQLLTNAAVPIVTTAQRSAESAPLAVQRAVDAVPVAAAQPVRASSSRQQLARSAESLPGLDWPMPARPSLLPADANTAIEPLPSMIKPSFPTSLPLARPTQPIVLGAPSVQRSAPIEASTEPERWSSVQTSTAVIEPELDEPSASMQRAPAREWTPSAAAAPEASGPSMVTAGEAAPATQGVDDEGHMEDLAARLYDRIRIRLRNELLVDRERAGFLTDLR